MPSLNNQKTTINQHFGNQYAFIRRYIVLMRKVNSVRELSELALVMEEGSDRHYRNSTKYQ